MAGPAIQVKAIKPRKLAVDKVRLELLNELRAEGRDEVRILQPTTDNWRGEKPTFEAVIGLSSTEATLIVGPVGSEKAVQKWVWLDEGTRPHPIVARRAPRLKFRTGYSASTSPGSFRSRGATVSGPWRSPVAVQHPGTAPRGWSEMLQKQRKRPYRDRMLAAVRRGMEKARQ